MLFGEILEDIKKGAAYTRLAWENTDRYVTIDEGEIVEVRSRKDFGGEPTPRPWKAASGDMIAEDWIKVQDAQKPEGDGTSN